MRQLPASAERAGWERGSRFVPKLEINVTLVCILVMLRKGQRGERRCAAEDERSDSTGVQQPRGAQVDFLFNCC